VEDGLLNDIKKLWSFNCTHPAVISSFFSIANPVRQMAYALSHLMCVIEHLEPTWTRALLRRVRFTDPDFQGDMLAVISEAYIAVYSAVADKWLRYLAMIASSLRTGTPLPQITPTPLLDRFMLKYHGLDIIHKESEEDYGLPRSLTLETLQSEQYLCVLLYFRQSLFY
jgi:hypothetical protein